MLTTSRRELRDFILASPVAADPRMTALIEDMTIRGLYAEATAAEIDTFDYVLDEHDEAAA